MIALSIEGTHHSNEDSWGCQDDVYWVLDGATRKGTKLPVSDYVERLNSNLKEVIIANPSVSLEQILHDAIAKTAFLSSEAGIPSATVAMVRKVAQSAECLVLGDAAVLLDNKVISDNRLQTIAIPERNRVIEMRKMNDVKGLDEATRNLLRVEDSLRNKADGFWVAANNPDAAFQGIASSGNGPRVALMTDGVSEGFERNWWKSPDEAFVDWYGKGLNESIIEFRNNLILQEKRADDMTVVLL